MSYPDWLGPRLNDAEQRLSEAREEIDALTRHKAGLTETVEELGRDLAKAQKRSRAWARLYQRACDRAEARGPALRFTALVWNAVRQGYMDYDGGEVQEWLEQAGVVTSEPYDPERHGPSAICEPGDDWLVLRAALPPAPRHQREHMSDWRPIETAPKDGREIIYIRLWRDIGHLGRCRWDEGDTDCEPAWWDYDADQEAQPTHWLPMPLPPAPVTGENQKGDGE